MRGVPLSNRPGYDPGKTMAGPVAPRPIDEVLLMGREVEFTALSSLVRSTAAGRGEALVFTGAAGLGKTTLL